MFAAIGSYCEFPRRPYTASELPAEYHPAVLERFTRAAYRDMVREAESPDPGRERVRSRAQRNGIRERAEHAGMDAYTRWLSLRSAVWCAAGDHAVAVNGIIRYMRRSGWAGFTGQRRSRNRAATAERLAWMHRRREALQDRPDSVAMARERVSGSPALSRKAYRLAQRCGMAGVPELLTAATLSECSVRGQYRPAPIPAPIPADDGIGRTAGRLYDFRHGVRSVD